MPVSLSNTIEKESSLRYPPYEPTSPNCPSPPADASQAYAGEINKDNSVDIRSSIDIIRCFTAYTSILRVKGDGLDHLP